MRLRPRADLAEKLDMHRRAVATFAKLLAPPPIPDVLGTQFIGSGHPTLTAPAGSLYMRSDGIPKLYVNLNGAEHWTEVGGPAPDPVISDVQECYQKVQLAGAHEWQKETISVLNTVAGSQWDKP